MRWFHYLLFVFFLVLAVWTLIPAEMMPLEVDRSQQPLLFGLYKPHCTFAPYSTIISIVLAVAVIIWGRTKKANTK
jgi:hypothetical protein